MRRCVCVDGSHAGLGGADGGEAGLAVEQGQLPEGPPRAVLEHLKLRRVCRRRRAAFVSGAGQ